MNAPERSTDTLADQLVQTVRSYSSCAVAMSAGVDSGVVAKAAQLAFGEQAIAITAVSPSLPAGELAAARELAALIGIRHHALTTHEMDRDAYRANAGDRCYHCKTELYTQIAAIAEQFGFTRILNGTNLDDLGDYRPGLQAAREHDVASPLVECRLGKQDVRRLAHYWQLPVWDKPAAPCLSSRIAYGEEVTPARLQMIDQAEEWLRERGFWPCRVRLHRDELARIEVECERLAALLAIRGEVVEHLRGLGFRFVTFDLEGLRSGSLNLVPLLDRLRT